MLLAAVLILIIHELFIKIFFARIGVGYFKQKFGINRPFDFDETGGPSSNLLYFTKYYSYSTLNYFGGVGYQLIFKKVLT